MCKSFAFVAALGLLAACSSSDMSSTPSGQNDQQGQGINRSSIDASNNSMPNSSSSVSDQDRRFVHDAAIGGMAEMEEGKIAGQQAGNDQVRQLGQHMVADHTKANDELKQLAMSKSISVPTDLDSMHQSAIAELTKMNGGGFDQKYVSNQVKDHEDAIKLFQTESRQGQDGELKAFAAKTIPTLEHHLQMVKDADKNVRSMSNGNSINSNQGSMNSGSSNPGMSNQPGNQNGNLNPGDTGNTGSTSTGQGGAGANGGANGR